MFKQEIHKVLPFFYLQVIRHGSILQMGGHGKDSYVKHSTQSSRISQQHADQYEGIAQREKTLKGSPLLV